MDSTSKLKRLCHGLISWSREAFEEIYEKPKQLEKKIDDLEEELVMMPSN